MGYILCYLTSYPCSIMHPEAEGLCKSWNINRGKSPYTLDWTFTASILIKHCNIVQFERIGDVIFVVVELKFRL